MSINEELSSVKGTFKKCIINAKLDAMERYALGRIGSSGIAHKLYLSYDKPTNIYKLNPGFGMVNGALMYLEEEVSFVESSPSSMNTWAAVLDNSKVNQASTTTFINNSLMMNNKLISYNQPLNTQVLGKFSTNTSTNSVTAVTIQSFRAPYGTLLSTPSGISLKNIFDVRNAVLPNNRIKFSFSFEVTKALTEGQRICYLDSMGGIGLGVTNEYRSGSIWGINPDTEESIELYSKSDSPDLYLGKMYNKRNATTNTASAMSTLPAVGSTWTVNGYWYYGRN